MLAELERPRLLLSTRRRIRMHSVRSISAIPASPMPNHRFASRARSGAEADAAMFRADAGNGTKADAAGRRAAAGGVQGSRAALYKRCHGSRRTR